MFKHIERFLVIKKIMFQIKFKEYLVSRINFLVNQFLINLTICNNSNLKNIFKKLSQLKLLDKEIQKITKRRK